MRNKRGREDGKCLVFSLHCGDQCSFVSEIGRHLGIILFPFLLTPANCAANILILFVQHQYIGAADQLAPIYW